MRRALPVISLVALGLAVCATSALAAEEQPTAQRAIPADNLAYPVLVQVPLAGNPKMSAQGTGFYLNLPKHTYLITARHNVFKPGTDTLLGPRARLTSYGDRPGDQIDLSKRMNVEVDLAAMQAADQLAHETGLDALGIPIAIHTSNELTKLAKNVSRGGSDAGLVGVGWRNTKRFDEILIGNDVFIFGYPTAIGLSKIPQLDYSRPLIRKGIVAGLNEKKRTIILDLAIYGGNSGGPVLEVHQTGPFSINYRVIGLVTDFIPTEGVTQATRSARNPDDVDNSGYSVAVPMEVVFEMLTRHGVVTKIGR